MHGFRWHLIEVDGGPLSRTDKWSENFTKQPVDKDREINLRNLYILEIYKLLNNVTTQIKLFICFAYLRPQIAIAF